MAIVDFTEYTEVDPSNEVAVTSTKLDFVTMAIDEKIYVSKDYGASAFGDFVHRQKSVYTAATYDGADSGRCIMWGLTNTANRTYIEMSSEPEGLAIEFSRSGDNGRLILQHDVLNVAQDFYYVGGVGGPPWIQYWEIERSGSIFTLKVYNNSDFTDIIDTLTVEDVSTVAYQYHIALASYGAVSDDDTITGSVENFDLVAASAITKVGTTTYADTSKVGTVAVAGISGVGSVDV